VVGTRWRSSFSSTPQLGVEVGQRLVEQEHGGVAHDAAAERHPLLLAAGQLPRPPGQQLLDAEDLRRPGDLRADLRLGRLPVAQPEGQVVVDRHVLIEGVVLEHHGDVAVPRRQVVDQPAADLDGAGADLLEPGHHAQGGRLAAAGRPDQHDELGVVDRQAEVLHRDDGTVGLGNVLEGDFRH
jgi:hypothetical protein